MTLTSIGYRIGNYAGDVANGVIGVPETLGFVTAHVGATVTGVLATGASLCTGGTVKKFNESAKHVERADSIIPALFHRIAHIVNKNNDPSPEGDIPLGPFRERFDLFARAHFLAQDMEFVAVKKGQVGINENILELEDGQVEANRNFLKNHLFSRLAYLAAGLLAVVARIVDLVIGVILGIATLFISLTTDQPNIVIIENNPEFCKEKKKIKRLEFTDSCLSFNVVDDVCKALRGFVNPHQDCLVDHDTDKKLIKYLQEKARAAIAASKK